MAQTLKTVKLADIDPASDNLRQDVGDIQHLADSIAFIGLLEPIVLVKDGDRYKIVAGERRYRALLLNGETETKAIIQTGLGEQHRQAAFLIENMQRVNLEPKEQAEGVRRLMQVHGMTQAEVADSLGVTKQWVQDRVAMLNVPDFVFEQPMKGWTDRKMDVEHLALLGKLPDDVRERLLKDEKVPSNYDIEDRWNKVKAKEKAERDLAKMQKAGLLAVTEPQLKSIMKADLSELDGLDQLVKLKLGDVAEKIQKGYGVGRPSERTVLLRQHFGGEMDDKAKVYVVSMGGYPTWYVVDFIEPIVVDDLEQEPDEYDEYQLAMDEWKNQCRVAEKEYVDTQKPANMLAIYLTTQLAQSLQGFRSDVTIARVAYLLGIEHTDAVQEADEDSAEFFERRNTTLMETKQRIFDYANKASTNLSRAIVAADLARSNHMHSYDVAYPEQPELPADEEDPLEVGV